MLRNIYTLPMKTIWKFLKSKFLWINILLAIVAIVIIYTVVLVWLKTYTHHGSGYEVPDLKGLYIEEAELVLEGSPIGFEVIDSVYKRNLKPGEIAEQIPAPGTKIKQGRKIYLTTNKKQQKLVTVPYLIGESRRKAQSNLRTLGFKVDSVRTKPYEYDDEVLDILYKEQPLDSLACIPDGSELIIVVGEAVDEEITIPHLAGLRYSDAQNLIEEKMLSVGSIHFDIMPISDEDREKYYVYEQEPVAGTVVKGGKRVNIKLSKIKGKSSDKTQESTEPDEFF